MFCSMLLRLIFGRKILLTQIYYNSVEITFAVFGLSFVSSYGKLADIHMFSFFSLTEIRIMACHV